MLSVYTNKQTTLHAYILISRPSCMQGERAVQIAESIRTRCKNSNQFDLLFEMLLDHLGNPSFTTRHSAEWRSWQCRLGERRRSEEVIDSPSFAFPWQDVKSHKVHPLELYSIGWLIMGYCPAGCEFLQITMLLIMGYCTIRCEFFQTNHVTFENCARSCIDKFSSELGCLGARNCKNVCTLIKLNRLN